MKKFSILYTDWKPDEQKHREAICTLGNGYIATRGAAEESNNDGVNYPGTYLAGGFNRAKTDVSGRTIENEDFVNFPNWTYLTFREIEGEWLDLEKCKILDYRQELQMKKGLLERNFRVEDSQGRCTSIRSRRIVSMHQKHMACLEWTFLPENWSGKVEFRSGLDGDVINDNVERYSDLESHHLNPLDTRKVNDNTILLSVQTKQSKITMAQAARTVLFHQDQAMQPAIEIHQKEGYISQLFRVEVKEGQEYILEKTVAIYTSRDVAISEPELEACKSVKRADRFKDLLLSHSHAWDSLWHRADIHLTNDDKNQRLLRLHIFHILQTVSPNVIGVDVGVPARGLHGEAYRGHIFWDELFIFPFLNLRFPEITRSLLMYRYYRLEEAKAAAKEDGKRGAMFPWQSGSNGRSESQVLHLNPNSGRWLADNTYLQRHVNSAIAYNIWNYFRTTGDRDFMSFFGAEIFLNIASYWASMVTYNEREDRYEIVHVVGPDEYHTSYPDSEESGLNNNAYTNVMAAWVMQKGIEILEIIDSRRRQELLNELDIDAKEIRLWKEISSKMYVPFIEDGIINQFDGYEKLEEFPWEEYQKKYEDIHRLDRILENENKDPNSYKASKQADVLMLFYLFSRDEIYAIFKKLGHEMTEGAILKNIEYYKKRTSHGSTLSRVVFSWIMLKYDKLQSWENFEKVLVSDFEDIQGGTTAEGIHLGAMAGSLDLVQRGFLGLEVGEEALWVNPHKLEHLEQVSLKIKYRSHWVLISVEDELLKISFEEGNSDRLNIGVIDKIHQFERGVVKEFSLV
ncbi:trehalose/maltose hydrolase-like predicted phosphorylase [Algoriphagus sp. 4150]|uniref:glycoside hydrolase family 65 protein n=1 Tax=Algoriphagus sp. 4150 TaxID=2817756 RepID=UPI002857D40F|nr:glycosyl hydrolase family 65 protein [Algoriphagus sp. 4150]MDR7127859.1 trehalose/maltose hydrolase-like predicted phosphorylase [Algoriphagus sp. 4150]